MSETTQKEDWQQHALAEIASIKEHFVRRYGWEITTQQLDDSISLFVKMHHKRHPERIHVLKLTYEQGFPQKRPRESFVNPNDYEQEGIEFWIDDRNQAFKRNHNPSAICLEGTWGFHNVLHKDRDPMRASINKLLIEVQEVFNKT